MGNEGVGVGTGIDTIAARFAIGIVGNRLFDLRDQFFRCRPMNGHHLTRRVGIPIGIRRIAIVAYRHSPAHLVVAIIGRRARLFQHDPGMAGDGAFKATGHGGKNVNRRLPVGTGLRQGAGGRPARVTPALRVIPHGPQPRRCQSWQQIDDGNRQQQTFCKFH